MIDKEFEITAEEVIRANEAMKWLGQGAIVTPPYETREYFIQRVVLPRLNLIKQTLDIKALEYSRNTNPFHNFDKGASRSGKEPEQVLFGFAEKHFISIDDIVNDLPHCPYPQVFEEKIQDAICYLILLEGLLKRRHAREIEQNNTISPGE